MLSTLALFGFAASALAQGVTQSISPPDPAPPGCRVTDDNEFSITTVNATTSTSSRFVKRQSDAMGKLTIRLRNGVLISNRGDTGYIAANSQFQFDSPPQTGAIYTAGFSICPNNTLAIGDSTIFYSCLSGSFSNLYSKSQGQQCSQVFIEALDAGSASSSPSSSTPSATPSPSSSAASATSAAPVTSIADSQPQGATSAPVAQSSVTQIGDNQPQAPTAAPSPTPSPIYTAGAAGSGANLALAGVALLAAAML